MPGVFPTQKCWANRSPIRFTKFHLTSLYIFHPLKATKKRGESGAICERVFVLNPGCINEKAIGWVGVPSCSSLPTHHERITTSPVPINTPCNSMRKSGCRALHVSLASSLPLPRKTHKRMCRNIGRTFSLCHLTDLQIIVVLCFRIDLFICFFSQTVLQAF